MGTYHGKCPKCKQIISFRDEHTDWANFLDEEYNKGYANGIGDKESVEEANRQVSAMQELLDANVRILRQEIEKQVRKSCS